MYKKIPDNADGDIIWNLYIIYLMQQCKAGGRMQNLVYDKCGFMRLPAYPRVRVPREFDCLHDAHGKQSNFANAIRLPD
jgi:hypothetical protein